MSLDTVDDLHAAEDAAGTLATALETLVRQVRLTYPYSGPRLVEEATAALAEWAAFCRPTCGYLVDGECADGEDTCGCPCDHEDGTDGA